MPMYMDRHDAQSATAEDIANAHVRDLEVQQRYGVRYLSYWFDPKEGAAFCFVDAPSRQAAEDVHKEAHGLVAARIIEVDPRTVTEFLGTITEPTPGEPWVQSGFRTILFTDMEGSTAVTQRLGDAGAMELVRTHNTIVRQALGTLGGREVKHTGDGIMASFASVARAVECAIAIQRKLEEHNEQHADSPIRVRVGLTAGEPVEESDDLFGAAVQLASRICGCAEPGRILVSNVVRELAIGKGFLFADRGERDLRGFEEPVRLYEVRWREEST